MKHFFAFLLIFACALGFGQVTKADETKLLKPGASLYWPRVNAAGTAVEWLSSAAAQAALSHWTESGGNVERANGRVLIPSLDITGQVWNTLGSKNFVRVTGYGYSPTAYPILQFGESNSNPYYGLAIGVDPTTVTDGNFTGNELLLPSVGWLTPDVANNVFRGIMKPTSDRIYIGSIGHSFSNPSMTVMYGGNIGINVTNPIAALDVSGTFRLNNSASIGAYLKSTDILGNTTWASTATAQSDLNYFTKTGSDIAYTAGTVGVSGLAGTSTRLPTVSSAGGTGTAGGAPPSSTPDAARSASLIACDSEPPTSSRTSTYWAWLVSWYSSTST